MECGVVALTRIERKKFLDIGSRTKYLLHPTFQTLKSSLAIMTYKPMETGIGIQQISRFNEFNYQNSELPPVSPSYSVEYQNHSISLSVSYSFEGILPVPHLRRAMTKDVGQPFGDRVIVVVATPVASISVSPVTLTRRDGRTMDGDWMVVGKNW